MKSSRKEDRKILGVMAMQRAEGLLLEIANLRLSEPEASHRTIARYPDVFKLIRGKANQGATLLIMHSHLQKAWDAPDSRQRQWWLFKLRDDYQRIVSGSRYNENYVDNIRPPI